MPFAPVLLVCTLTTIGAAAVQELFLLLQPAPLLSQLCLLLLDAGQHRLRPLLLLALELSLPLLHRLLERNRLLNAAAKQRLRLSPRRAQVGGDGLGGGGGMERADVFVCECTQVFV